MDIEMMTTYQRAKALVGDMPWVTKHLTQKQIVDMIQQVKTCLDAAVYQARENDRQPSW